MASEYYIASCVFSTQFPQHSSKIQAYITQRYSMATVRCCIPKYRLRDFEEKMPEEYRSQWKALPDCADFQEGDTVYSLCHNCSNIVEETKKGVNILSLWELIASDERFIFPDYSGLRVTVQDCWRSKERLAEQHAVRKLLHKMGIECVELKDNFGQTDFCGASLYRPQPARNPKLSPQHYVENAKGKFLPHSPEEQKSIMENYCEQFTTEHVICYCHYCLEGLLLGGTKAQHIAHLLFA